MNKNDIQKQLARLRRNKRFLWLGVMFFLLVILWISTSIFTVARTSSISQEFRDLAKSFIPRLESRVFDQISGKRAFSEDELEIFPIYILDKNKVDDDFALIDITTPKENVLEIDNISQNYLATQAGQPNLESSSSSQEIQSQIQKDEQFAEPI